MYYVHQDCKYLLRSTAEQALSVQAHDLPQSGQGRSERRQDHMSEEKWSTGRPTKYRPEMCERVVELFSQGASKAEVCADLRINFDTCREWEVSNKDFSEAIRNGLVLAEAWWSNKGKEGMESKNFNPAIWIFNMKNRFRHNWRDTTEHELTGKDGGAIEFSRLDRANRIAIIANAAKARKNKGEKP